jgi:hypothetical protein
MTRQVSSRHLPTFPIVCLFFSSQLVCTILHSLPQKPNDYVFTCSCLLIPWGLICLPGLCQLQQRQAAACMQQASTFGQGGISARAPIIRIATLKVKEVQTERCLSGKRLATLGMVGAGKITHRCACPFWNLTHPPKLLIVLDSYLMLMPQEMHTCV